MDNNEYLDFDGAVSFLKTTPSTLYKWLQAGKIPGHKLGRQWRFLKEELEIHVSGKGSKINIQKDFLALTELLTSRTKLKENKVELNIANLPEKIIWDAFDHGSRTIHIYPAKGKYEISYRTEIGLETLSSIQEDTFAEIDESIKKNSTAREDGSTRRLYLHRSDEDVLQVIYHKIETVTGPRVTLKLWQPEKDALPLEKITGSDKVSLNQFKSWLNKTSGLFFVSGSPGSGKTTTIYSLLKEYKDLGHVVFTIEDSAMLIIEGINQIELKGKAASQFQETFDSVYSSDPDVICLGLANYMGIEEKVFTEASHAAASGHIVLIQMDQPSCKDAIEIFKKFVKHPVDHLIAGVSCQKLVSLENGKRKAVYEFLDSKA